MNNLQNISCVSQRKGNLFLLFLSDIRYIKWWQYCIFVFGWSVPLRLAKIIINVQGQVFNQNLGRLMSIWSTMQEHACHDSFLKSLKLFEEKSSVYENNSPLSTCASFPKQPPWKLCSLFELEINSSIKATHTHKHTSPDSCSNIHFSQITFIQPFLASITSIWACVNLQRNTSSNIPSKPTNLQPLVLFLLDALQTSFWRKETGASVDSGRFW